MKAINTMTDDEYNRRLYEASKRMFKTIARIMDMELLTSTKADNDGQEEIALKHDFKARALSLAAHTLLITPNKTKQQKNNSYIK